MPDIDDTWLPLPLEPGHKIRDLYELQAIAGTGGMACVWRAQQHGSLGFCRTVAVKQMHDHLRKSQLYVDMFAEEARIGAALQSPNIAHVYDFVAEDGHFFLVLEWVEGIDLGNYVRHYVKRERQTPWELVVGIGVGILRALADAHERSDNSGNPAAVIHRDVSPHNILVTERGMVKLIDFGLSLAQDRRTETTDPGVVKGKMSYLAPEVVKGERPTVLSDQFSVGTVLWEALVGRKLFDGETDFDVYKKLKEGQVAPLRPQRRDLPKSVVAVIHKALSTDPADRFESAREMGKHLSHALKSARAPKDLHQLLGKTVVEARAALDIIEGSAETSTTTPIADSQIDSVDLARVRSSAERNPRATGPIDTSDATAVDKRRRGLLHQVPFFGRRR